MIEVLVTMIILLVGLLGLAGMILHAQRSEMESYQRVQALVLLEDMIGRISANHQKAACYQTSTLSPAYVGTTGATIATCGTGTLQDLKAQSDLTEWAQLLAGAAESGSSGAMLGGRGCVEYDATNMIAMVSVAWQGLGDTAAPPASLTCGSGLYGSETKRRVVSMPVRFANLSAP